MKLLRLIYQRETIAPIFALTFASAAGVLLVSARVVWTGNLHYAFLVWNLFLAWQPLVFAMCAREAHQEGRSRWRFLGFSAAWLLFFPNAP